MKKYLLRAVYILLFLVGCCAIYAGLDYIVSDDTSSQTRVTFHDFYDEGTVDYLFVGPSHTIHAINAVSLSKTLDASVFNLATSSQDFIGGYYVLKDAIETGDIRHVIYEVSISRFEIEETLEVKTYIISDYMKSQWIRAQYLTDALGSDQYPNGFFRLRRNFDPQNPPTAEKFAKVYTNKQDEAYLAYEGTEDYFGKGQWSEPTSWAYEGTAALNTREWNLDNFPLEQIQPKEWEYFLKIIQLCKEKDVDLTFYIPPYSDLYLMRFEQYEEITQRVYDAAAENGITVVDLNLAKKEYLPIEISDFFNSDHVNDAASVKIAAFFTQYLKDPDKDYFYDSLHDNHPINDDIIAVLYRRLYAQDDGLEFYWPQPETTSLRMEISALSWVERPVDVRVWKTTQSITGESVWFDGEEIVGLKLDEYTTQFRMPYDNMRSFYRVQLLDPDTGEVLYETITRFNMT